MLSQAPDEPAPTQVIAGRKQRVALRVHPGQRIFEQTERLGYQLAGSQARERQVIEHSNNGRSLVPLDTEHQEAPSAFGGQENAIQPQGWRR
jgi:hypothetical protein